MGDLNLVKIRYDILCYDNGQFSQIQKLSTADVSFDIKPLKQKTAELVPLVVITFASIFFKGFFTKMGEKMGEQVADAIGKDVVSVYQSFKKFLSKAVLSTKSVKVPLLRIEIVGKQTKFVIHIKPKTEEAIEHVLDNIEKIYTETQKFLKIKKVTDAKEVCLTLSEDGNRINRLYFIDDNNNAYASQ